MKSDKFSKLITFLDRLDEAKIPYTMEHSRDDAVMVTAMAPGEYWEIEFMLNDEIEIERYRSNGKIYDESVLDELFALCSDEETPTEDAAKQHDAIARK